MHAKVLESEKHPLFHFEPSRIVGRPVDDGSSEVELQGTMTVRGEAHPMMLLARVEVVDGRLTATTTFTVPYVEWGMKDPSFLFLRVAKVVEVTIEAVGTLD